MSSIRVARGLFTTILRARFTTGCRLSGKRTYSTSRLSSVSAALSRPFEDFFASPTDAEARMTAEAFEPFAAHGLPILLRANLVSEAFPDTYEITEKGNVVLQELQQRMNKAKSITDPSISFFGPNTHKGSDVESIRPNLFGSSRRALKKLWTDLGATVYEVEEPTYLRPSPTGVKHHLYISTQAGSQSLLHCTNCSITQLAPYALTKPKTPANPLTVPSNPSRVTVSLSALHHPISDMFYALVTRIGVIPHEDRIRAALLASYTSPTSQNTAMPLSVPARILIDDTAGVALSGQAARLWFDRLRLSIEQACPKVMNGRSAELDREPGRVFVATAPGTSSTGSPASLAPHHGQTHRDYARGFILGNFRNAGDLLEETCLSCSGQLENVRAAWVAKVALAESEMGGGGSEEVTVRVLNPLPMLAALATTGTLVS